MVPTSFGIETTIVIKATMPAEEPTPPALKPPAAPTEVPEPPDRHPPLEVTPPDDSDVVTNALENGQVGPTETEDSGGGGSTETEDNRDGGGGPTETEDNGGDGPTETDDNAGGGGISNSSTTGMPPGSPPNGAPPTSFTPSPSPAVLTSTPVAVVLSFPMNGTSTAMVAPTTSSAGLSPIGQTPIGTFGSIDVFITPTATHSRTGDIDGTPSLTLAPPVISTSRRETTVGDSSPSAGTTVRTTLVRPSTRVYSSASIYINNNGQEVTSFFVKTTVLPSGYVVTADSGDGALSISPARRSKKIARIVGSSVGGLVFLSLVGIFLFFFFRRKRRRGVVDGAVMDDPVNPMARYRDYDGEGGYAAYTNDTAQQPALNPYAESSINPQTRLLLSSSATELVGVSHVTIGARAPSNVNWAFPSDVGEHNQSYASFGTTTPVDASRMRSRSTSNVSSHSPQPFKQHYVLRRLSRTSQSDSRGVYSSLPLHSKGDPKYSTIQIPLTSTSTFPSSSIIERPQMEITVSPKSKSAIDLSSSSTIASTYPAHWDHTASFAKPGRRSRLQELYPSKNKGGYPAVNTASGAAIGTGYGSRPPRYLRTRISDEGAAAWREEVLRVANGERI
ncbi:hypothetical protein CC2G_001768 [Coprinopsis cinerea AmutBmut pab1-1]|nr:hypothetical protein CC2G_001768 [Coprinopsis cinerea AmutBmut pab1-1]